jgi:hypothetical protein
VGTFPEFCTLFLSTRASCPAHRTSLISLPNNTRYSVTAPWLQYFKLHLVPANATQNKSFSEMTCPFQPHSEHKGPLEVTGLAWILITEQCSTLDFFISTRLSSAMVCGTTDRCLIDSLSFIVFLYDVFFFLYISLLYMETRKQVYGFRIGKSLCYWFCFL